MQHLLGEYRPKVIVNQKTGTVVLLLLTPSTTNLHSPEKMDSQNSIHIARVLANSASLHAQWSGLPPLDATALSSLLRHAHDAQSEDSFRSTVLASGPENRDMFAGHIAGIAQQGLTKKFKGNYDAAWAQRRKVKKVKRMALRDVDAEWADLKDDQDQRTKDRDARFSFFIIIFNKSYLQI